MFGLSKGQVRNNQATAGRLSPLDVLRCGVFGLPGGSNRAFPLRAFGRAGPTHPLLELAKLGLTPRSPSFVWIARCGLHPTVIAAINQRSGPTSWEIVDLYLEGTGEGLTDVLDALTRAAASRGGQAVFLRLAKKDPLVDAARLSGFFPCLAETLFSRPDGDLRPQPGGALSERPNEVRDRKPADDHGLFRLYNAATPAEARHLIGMTLDQWKSSRQRSQDSHDEWVIEENGTIVGWLRRTLGKSITLLEVEAHPDHASQLAALLDFGLGGAPSNRQARCLVAEHQTGLAHLLAARGFETAGDFVSLVKRTTVPVEGGTRVRTTASA